MPDRAHPAVDPAAAPGRLDGELVRRGLVRSRGQARDLIARGAVTVDGVPAAKGSLLVGPELRVAVEEGPRWVSRAAYKLVGALAAFGERGLAVEGRRCVDVGASTGGFTQVLLAAGAREVVAVDVGHDQLDQGLAADPRVVDRPRTTVRGLTPADVGGPAELVVADLSFISVRLVLDELRGLVADDGDLVLLVKPQFEVGRGRLGKSGVVRRPADRRAALAAVVDAAGRVGLNLAGVAASPLRGAAGNAEYLVWCTRRPGGGLADEDVTAVVASVTAAP